MKKVFVISLTLCCIIIVCLFVKFVCVPTMSSTSISKQYTIDSIYEAGVKDIVFQTEEDGKLLYINRGLENYSIDYFQSYLLHKPAYFVFQLSESHKAHPITRIECEGKVIYKF